MPIYEYSCGDHVTEHLCSYSTRPSEITCKVCGKPAGRKVHQVARMSYSWGDTQWDKYDHGLGTHVRSKAHREQVMKAKGLVEVSPDDSDRIIDRNVAAEEEHDRRVDTLQQNIANLGHDRGWEKTYNDGVL